MVKVATIHPMVILAPACYNGIVIIIKTPGYFCKLAAKDPGAVVKKTA